MIDYKELKLKCGLEIHLQLDTKTKLFCNCLTTQSEKEPVDIVLRKLHPVQSELGEIDAAAQFEYLRDRTFYYQTFKKESCSVELDEEPPHEINREALEIGLQISLLLNCEIPNEIHVMRKIVIDGSNTSGFQRTMIIGKNGFFEYKGRRIGIASICLEEDSAAIVKEENGKVTYRLNRLGIPLVEISTETLENFSPEEIQEIAFQIGLIAKSTGKIKREVGAIRQDINVSIKNGERVEIKGIQELSLLKKVIEIEVERQLKLGKVEKETRAALPNGTTRYMRPLPGAARMYVETDIPPIKIEELIKKIEKELPENLIKKIERFEKELKLSEDLAKQIVLSDYLQVFEEIVHKQKILPSIVASFFVYNLKDLERKKEIKIENLGKKHFIEVFKLLSEKKIVKEALPEIFISLSKNPEKDVKKLVKELNLEILSKEEIEKIANEILRKNPGISKKKLIDIVMSKVRGKAEAKDVIKIVNKLLSIS